ncbi:MAG: LTA synthase family protein [Lachnospiraceae bacterium]|nr:LTA synthase family protein [Lachnospiraceae bacterium]
MEYTNESWLGRLRERRGLAAAILLLSPLLMYAVFEWITGNLFSVQGIYLLWNLLFFMLLYLTVFSLTNSVRISYTLLNVFFTFWALAEYFVVEFRSRPIMLWDVLAVRTAATVAGNYQYTFTRHMAAGVLVIALWTGLIWLFPFRLRTKKQHIYAAAGSAFSFCAALAVFYQIGITKCNISISMWEPLASYEKNGCLVSTLRVFAYLAVKPPEGYSVSEVERIQREIEERKEDIVLPFRDAGNVVPTNVICIMNESFADLRVIAPFETDVPFLSYYESLTENCIKGDLYVPVFGSMTCNSEFEFLTGNSLTFAPEGSVPFQLYMRKPSYSIVSILKDKGYRTVAMHPNQKTNWNRAEAYGALGFDEFYGIESFENPYIVRGLVGDRGDYDKIISLTKSKEAGEPLFVFDVTMQNHGGYEEGWEATVHLKELSDMPKTEQYLSLIRESDAALQYLLEYYSQIEEPTMIVLFGDHQPAVEESLYETLYGAPLVEKEYQDLIRRHITPFLIWTNYPSESMENVSMSAQYLAGAALQRANIELTDYFYFLSEMYQAAPVVHFYGYERNDGILIDWSTWREQPEYTMFYEFEILQYNNMFDKKRMDAIFRNGP